MRISFLIPSYNHSKYIEHALDSIVLDANLINYEIILIDDGSTDESKEVIELWRKINFNVNITAIYRENRGLCATLNELVSKASGDVIRVCASDDGMYAGSTLKLIKVLELSGVSVAVGDAIVIDEANNIISNSAITVNGGDVKKMSKSEYLLKHEIVSNWSLPGPCFAIKREVYQIVGNYSEDLTVEDWDFFLRVVALCSMQFVNEPVAYYRLHGENACKTKDINKRVLNTSSQKKASFRNLSLFKGFFFYLLLQEGIILNFKLFYLKAIMFISDIKKVIATKT